MKKTLFFGLMAAALGFTACSNEDDRMVNNQNNKKGMVLRATVEQPAETRATFTDSEGGWQFAFATDDKVSVTNNDMTPNFYTFTNDSTEFKCEEAKTTASDVTWSAYFPSNEISLVRQSGKKEDVANKYALAGQTESATTGKEGLSITMSPKVAILVIKNQKGAIDINVKNGASTWVSGLEANAASFNVTTDTTKQTLLSATKTGTYYVAVPAGIQLAVKDGDKTIKSTGTNGLTAGKYYNLTILGPTTGKAYAAAPACEVNWVQLWAGGPKFAEYNVGATSAAAYGGYYCWGSTVNKDASKAYKNGTNAISGKDDTATNLWGDNWRMPTQEEFAALLNQEYCKCTWTENYNGTSIKGLLCQGKEGTAFASNSVFLPAAGGCWEVGVYEQNTYCHYWSSTPFEIDHAYRLTTKPSKSIVDDWRANGYSVRPVLNEAE